jgi:hypothetical protein
MTAAEIVKLVKQEAAVLEYLTRELHPPLALGAYAMVMGKILGTTLDDKETLKIAMDSLFQTIRVTAGDFLAAKGEVRH